MQRGFVEAALFVIAQFEHFQRQFAACDHEWPAARHPAHVVGLMPDKRWAIVFATRQWADGNMHAGIVEADDLALHHDGVGHVDHFLEDAGEAERDGGFAVPRRTIKQDGPA